MEEGTIRIRTKDMASVRLKNGWWVKAHLEFPNIMRILSFYEAHKAIKFCLNPKEPKFFRGELSPKGKPKGGRILYLPNGKKLDHAFPIFAPHLALHDESSHDHWDALYQNTGGGFSYCYTEDKIAQASKKKYRKVHEFAKVYSQLKRKVNLALKNPKDNLALPMYTLLTTYMRIGNEIYLKADGHKGLTTLTKKDISVKGNVVTFKYVAKDGVPRKIYGEFPKVYVKRLKQRLRRIDGGSFVFANRGQKHPLRDTQFKEAFKRYVGKEFYPHIVRSYIATKETQKFLKKEKFTKQEMRNFFSELAYMLGHKKFDKNDNEWKPSYSVTLAYYVEPKLVERVKARAQ